MVGSIRYMGNKRSLAPLISQQISARHPNSTILDVFAGMCAVGKELAPDHLIYTNDIHAFAGVVAKSLFKSSPIGPTSLHAREELLPKFNENQCELSGLLRNQIHEEDKALGRAADPLGWRVLKGLSDAALSQPVPLELVGVPALTAYQANNALFPYHLFTSYFSNAYFGVRQSIEIDSLRYAIDHAKAKHRPRYLTALMQAMSHCAATPGHFAQYLVPRDRKNTAYIGKIRQRSIVARFFEALDHFPQILCKARRKNRVFREDASDLLSKWSGGFKDGDLVIYADPPYSRAQYSRYYHVLETLILYDYPECSGKGRYRNGRFSTEFSKKSSVYNAMNRFISSASRTGAPIYVSYPSNGLLFSAGFGLKDILKKHYDKVELLSGESLNHSTMGASPGTASVIVRENVYYAGWK